jgi:starch synthase (maltosyl-transferring)
MDASSRQTARPAAKPAAKSAARRPVPNRKQSERRLETLAHDRFAIEGIYPEIDGGRFPVKRMQGEVFTVWADVFCDGHDVIRAALRWRREGEKAWQEAPMTFHGNDRWSGSFVLETIGHTEYAIEAWRDLFASWRAAVLKKLDAGQNVEVEARIGRHLVEDALAHATGSNQRLLTDLMGQVNALLAEERSPLDLLLRDETFGLMTRAGVRTNLTRLDPPMQVQVDREAAAFSAWYEMMPRSQSGDVNRHGTFDDVIDRLPYVRDLGFDVLYFTPIHPIGTAHRKGKNNTLEAQPGDPGSPYAIGSHEGGHDAIHPELGTFDDFHRLVKEAKAHGLEIALDFAIQCSPDHPWIEAHPEWFDWRPDGTIQYAENPPKKYEDIVNVHFYRGAIPSLWFELRDLVLFWIDHGVTIFRVDNPHTKPFPFWEWMIREVQVRHPEAVFLSEAFTRPKVMKRLAKVGFTQSYSYFTWRTGKQEFVDYLTELTREECAEFMRPNFFVNTPDINPYHLQSGKRATFQSRLVLAATLAGNWGMYNGFEICESQAVPGKEEYMHSEKYEIRAWDFDQPGHIKDDIRAVNRIRRENPAFRNFTGLTFYNFWNDNVLYYGKYTADLSSFVLVFVSLDPDHPQEGHYEVPLWEFGLPDQASVGATDLLQGTDFGLDGKVHHLRLDPHQRPYAIWRLNVPGYSA